MSIEQLRTEIIINQHHREEAVSHIKGLEAVLEAAMMPR
jgi:hypothetical protein